MDWALGEHMGHFQFPGMDDDENIDVFIYLKDLSFLIPGVTE